MKTVRFTFIPVAFLLLLLAACGTGNKEKAGKLGEKKAELATLRTEATKLADKIAALEAEIAILDTAAANNEVVKLVSIQALATADFSHYIELQGKVDAENISYVTPRGGPGQIAAIYIKKGDIVRKGQKVLKIDDRIILQQMEQVKSQLAFARDLLQRRENLWSQNIGSEVELLSARNNVTQLERQMSTLNEQWSMTNVVAEVNGYVDEVMVRVGEIFQGGPQIRIVNTSTLKVVADVPENYLSRIGKGSTLEVNVPDIQRDFSSVIAFVSASINPASRGFTIEGRLPADASLKPNQIALVKILDYSAPNAIIVPVNVVQNDEKGKFVFVLQQEGGNTVARKKPVVIGQVQGTQVEIKAGLAAGDKLITEGYQGLYDGQSITATP